MSILHHVTNRHVFPSVFDTTWLYLILSWGAWIYPSRDGWNTSTATVIGGESSQWEEDLQRGQVFGMKTVII